MEPGKEPLTLARITETATVAVVGVRDRYRLTAREAEVLRLIFEGKKQDDIAIELSISPRTVRAHVASIMRKAKLRSKSELTRLLLEAWLLAGQLH